MISKKYILGKQLLMNLHEKYPILIYQERDNKETHPLKILVKSLTLEVFHFDISGKYFKLVQLLNIESIFLTLEVFHFDISGNDINDSH